MPLHANRALVSFLADLYTCVSSQFPDFNLIPTSSARLLFIFDQQNVATHNGNMVHCPPFRHGQYLHSLCCIILASI
jgi:hypothetical protein